MLTVGLSTLQALGQQPYSPQGVLSWHLILALLPFTCGHPDGLVVPIDRAKLLMHAGEDLLIQGFCILVPALLQIAGGQAVLTLGHTGVIRLEVCGVDLQCHQQ